MNPVYLDEKFKSNCGKPRHRELSGRMLSHTFTTGSTSDIRDRANQVAKAQNEKRKKPNLEFRNLAYASVKAIRSYEKYILDIYLDPRKDDPAHANFIIINKIPVLDSKASPKNPHEIFRDLAKIIKIVDAKDTSKVEALWLTQASNSLKVSNNTDISPPTGGLR